MNYLLLLHAYLSQHLLARGLICAQGKYLACGLATVKCAHRVDRFGEDIPLGDACQKKNL